MRSWLWVLGLGLIACGRVGSEGAASGPSSDAGSGGAGGESSGAEPATEPSRRSCYYPELGENQTSVTARERQRRVDNECATTDCSADTRFLRCDRTGAEVEPGVAFEIVRWGATNNFIQVTRKWHDVGNLCVDAIFELPDSPLETLAVEMPDPGPLPGRSSAGWCGESPRIGALGFIRQSDSTSCAFDFDFTMFLVNQHDAVHPLRFKADQLGLTGGCP